MCVKQKIVSSCIVPLRYNGNLLGKCVCGKKDVAGY